MTNTTNKEPAPKCNTCLDGEIYPYYGLAPHKHDMTKTGSIIGSTVIDPESEWPSNFHPDAEDSGAGVWTCPNCDGYGQNAGSKS